MQEMKRDRHRNFATRHVIAHGRFVRELRPREIAETAGAEIDERPYARHGGANSCCRCARVSFRTLIDAVAQILAHAVHEMALPSQPEHIASDQAYPRIRRETV